ncbi:MAG: AAA family ATPase, partial [Fervidobacterium pennivorans]
MWMDLDYAETEKLYDAVKRQYEQALEPEEPEIPDGDIKYIIDKISQPLYDYKNYRDDILVAAAEIRAKYETDVSVIARLSYNYKGLRETLKSVVLSKYSCIGITPSKLERDIAKRREEFLQIGNPKYRYKLGEVFDDTIDATYLVDRFISTSGLYLLAAPPKTYKSLLSYHLAFCVARGLPFLGRFGVTKGKVLY